LGHNPGGILRGQLVFLVGILVGVVGVIVWDVPLGLPIVSGLLTAKMVLLVAGGGVVFTGVLLTLRGVLEGSEQNPFNLFFVGFLLALVSVGVFVMAGLFQELPFINPLWRGAVPKPEAAFFTCYAILQLVGTVMAFLRSIPQIFRESRQLWRID
jgi:hypothetical protein